MDARRTYLDERARRAQARYPASQSGYTYGSLTAPANDIESLRRQQAEFKAATRDISRQNRWMAVPALAPAVAALGLETAAAATARAAGSAAQRAPLVFREKLPHLRVTTGLRARTASARRAYRPSPSQGRLGC